jgi:hypothetical protein
VAAGTPSACAANIQIPCRLALPPFIAPDGA